MKTQSFSFCWSIKRFIIKYETRKGKFSLIPWIFPEIYCFYLENSIIVAILLDNNKIVRDKN